MCSDGTVHRKYTWGIIGVRLFACFYVCFYVCLLGNDINDLYGNDIDDLYGDVIDQLYSNDIDDLYGGGGLMSRIRKSV